MGVVAGERCGLGVLRWVSATALAAGSVAALTAGPAQASPVHVPPGHARSGSAAPRPALWSPGSGPPRSGPRHTSRRPWRPATLTNPSTPGTSASGWQVEPTPNPAGLANGDLTAESCFSAHACAAVGDYVNNHGTVVPLAEAWNGKTWARQAAPVPHGATSTQLNGVSCPSARSCVAAGFYTDAAGAVVPLAEAWNGTTWAIQSTTVPAGATGSGFYGIACGAPDACTAVGDYVGSGGASVTLAERWNGSTWAIQVTANPAGATNSALFGIACARTTCTATGAWSSGSGAVTLAERWNGSKWAIQATPGLSGAYISELTGVSCPSASVCVAAGYHQSDSGVTAPLAERWNGATWTMQATAAPSGATGSGLATVSCMAANACTAVGGYNTGTGSTLTLAERWNGSTWAIQSTVNPTGTTASELNAVSCPVLASAGLASAGPASSGAGECVAAGASKGGSGSPVPLAEGWNGTKWALQATANPTGARASELTGVSCAGPASTVPASTGPASTVPASTGPASTGADTCEAVGDSTGASLVNTTLAEAWNGTKWVIQRTPNPAKSGGSDLNGVSCPALASTGPASTGAGDCVAVGSYTTRAGAPAPLAETWNGTKWTLRTVPAPAAGKQAWLYSVACVSPHACLAVGTYNTSAGAQVGFAERWNGSTWTLLTVPAPPHSGGTSLQSVSCAVPASTVSASTVPASTGPASIGANVCEAGGSYIASTGAPAPLAEAWNGTKWTLQTVPLPSGSQGGSFVGMSCTSVTACTGTGTYYGNPGGAFAEGWNGKAWRFETVPNPPNGGSSSGDIVLGSVSCTVLDSTGLVSTGLVSTGAQHCYAVGNYNPGDTTASFAEGWNGVKWSLQTLALPPGAGGTRLNSVACAGARCAAVGDYFGTANLSVTLAESRSVG